jgi:DNA-binding transcriptional LysR family regulator
LKSFVKLSGRASRPHHTQRKGRSFQVASGAGITLLPLLAVSVESRRAGIHVRHFSKPAPHRTIGLVWRKGSPLDGALRKIAEVLRAAYPGSVA